MTAATIARNLRAEWRRVWSVRSSAVLAGLTAVGVIALAALGASQSANTAPAGGSPWQLAGFLSVPALLGTLVLVCVAVTSDHATGSIGPTLQWTPRRRILLLARMVTLPALGTALGVVLLTAAATVIWLFAPQLVLFATDTPTRLAVVALVFATTSLLAVGLGLLLRSTAATLAVVFALVLVLPLFLQVVPFAWATRLIEALPGSGVLYFLLGEGPGDTVMTAGSATLVLVGWAVAAVVLGSLRLLRSDADR